MKNSIEKICVNSGAQKYKNTYTLKTKIGTLQITDLSDDTFIPMKFEQDFNRAEFVKVSHDDTVGDYSFKWNLHAFDKSFNLGRLEQRLNFINTNFKL